MKKLYRLDQVAVKTFHWLLSDFRVLLDDPHFGEKAEIALNTSPKAFREYEFPVLGDMHPSRYKAWMQIQHLFKRYRFSRDAYTDAELLDRTSRKFIDFQVARSCYKPLSYRTFLVLKEARRIAGSILGPCELPAHYFKIGRRATLGGPLHKAYLDRKLGSPEMFTCPSALRGWWFSHISDDPHLRRIYRAISKESRKTGKFPDLSADSLNLVLVPKSWKIMRPITPLSNVGLYYSYGIGTAVADRLKDFGLNIRHLQDRHKRLARRFSATRSHVTADLSSASDSLTSAILNSVLPRPWYSALKATFIRQLNIDGHSFYTESVLPMGNGATFPVETLVFYCLIKAVGNLLRIPGVYSVYGDDLIYPTRLHPYIAEIFSDLGFGINADKTFVRSHFRESCGGDYYRGFDVRPAMLPENTSNGVSGLRYQQFLYKVLNALRRRWDDAEIRRTVNYLLTEIAATSGRILQVPLTFPDDCGLRVDVPFVDNFIPFEQPRTIFKDGSSWLYIKRISVATPTRVVVQELPYLWEKLRSLEGRKPDWHSSFGWFRRVASELIHLELRDRKSVV